MLELAWSRSTIDFYIDFPLFTAAACILRGDIDFTCIQAHSLTNCPELLFQGSQGHPLSLCVSFSLTSHAENPYTHTHTRTLAESVL